MSLFSGNVVNMDGSTDAGYRYTMPKVQVKKEGSSKMKKSVIVNLKEVSQAVGRPADYLLTYLGQSLSAMAKIEKDTAKAYIAGHHGEEVIQKHILAFVRDAIMCAHCSNPETTCCIEGSKKHKSLYLSCKSCGNRTSLDPSDRFVKYMLQHPPDNAIQGHANAIGGQPTAATALAALADAEAEDDPDKKKRSKCPSCGHKTSKSKCSKCGATVQKKDDASDGDVDAEVQQGLVEHKIEQVQSKHCREIVQEWMVDHQKIDLNEDSVHDFDAAICLSDARNATALERLNAVVWVIACDANAEYENREVLQKLQPIAVAKRVEPLIKHWSLLVSALYNRVDDSEASIGGIIRTLYESIANVPSASATQDTIVSGFLLSVREYIDEITDDGLLSGCRNIESRSNAMDKFIEFLAAADDCTEDDSDED